MGTLGCVSATSWQADAGTPAGPPPPALRPACSARARCLAAHLAATALLDRRARSFKEESRSRTAALRKLGFIDGEGAVTLKGRAACEIDTAGGCAGGGCRDRSRRASATAGAPPQPLAGV